MKTAREHTDILHSQIQRFGDQVSYNDILKAVRDVFDTCLEVCNADIRDMRNSGRKRDGCTALEMAKEWMTELKGPDPTGGSR